MMTPKGLDSAIGAHHPVASLVRWGHRSVRRQTRRHCPGWATGAWHITAGGRRRSGPAVGGSPSEQTNCWLLRAWDAIDRIRRRWTSRPWPASRCCQRRTSSGRSGGLRRLHRYLQRRRIERAMSYCGTPPSGHRDPLAVGFSSPAPSAAPSRPSSGSPLGLSARSAPLPVSVPSCSSRPDSTEQFWRSPQAP